MRYWEVSEEELEEFYSSLDSEKRTFGTKLHALLSSEFLLAERIDGEVVGICGLIKSRFLPRIYLVVKEKHHGKGIGKKLHKRLEEHIEKSHPFVKAIVRKENKIALRIFKEYNIVKEDGEFYYLIRLTRFRAFQPLFVLLFKLVSRVNLLVRYRLSYKGKL